MELELPIPETQTLEDMETSERVPYDPEHSRQPYLDQLHQHIDALKKECRSHLIDYELMNTQEPLDRALHRYLSVRDRRY